MTLQDFPLLLLVLWVMATNSDSLLTLPKSEEHEVHPGQSILVASKIRLQGNVLLLSSLQSRSKLGQMPPSEGNFSGHREII